MPRHRSLPAPRLSKWITSLLAMNKVCRKCGLDKPIASFYKHSGMQDGHLNICKVCRDLYVAEWSAKNRDRRRAIARVWANTKAVPANRATAFAKWYAKTKVNGTYHKQVERVARRTRLVARQATPSWANRFFIEEAYALARLRTEVTGIKWHVDHVVPLQSDVVCGLHCEGNLRVIPASENISKHNRYWPDMPC